MSEAVSNQSVPDPYGISLEKLDVSDPRLYEADSHWAYFERLRKEAPVHYCKDSAFGPFWSVSNYQYITEVDRNHQIFSSEPAIVLGDQPEDFTLKLFIAMDPPKHDAQRKAVTGVVAPTNLALLEPLIRERVVEIMDSLPVGETFNWVERVSIELTTRMLATLFDFPFERRSKLTYWSDMATSSPDIAGDDSVSEEERTAAPTGPRCACAAGSEVSLGGLLEDRVVQVRVRQQTLQARILTLELLQALGLIYSQSSVLLAPPVVRLLRDLELSADRRDRLPLRKFDLGRTQLVDDLLRAVAFLRHVSSPPG